MSLADLIKKSAEPVSDPDATLVEQASQNSLATMIQKAKDAGLIKPGFEYGAPVVA
jgi:hypothetical protein